jgi:hypothetical protein
VTARLALLLTAAAFAVAASPALSSERRHVATACPAARVHTEPNARLGTLSPGRWVAPIPARAGLIGYLFGGEVVGGRFAVYAGGRNPRTNSSEKVLWIVRRGARIGAELAVVGRRLGSTVVRYRRHFSQASSDQTPGYLFPSILDLPQPGCWSLTLRSGRVAAKVVVLAQATG